MDTSVEISLEMIVMKLIEVLKKIEADDSIEYKSYLTDGSEDDYHPLVLEAVGLAEDALVDDSGYPPGSARGLLLKEGFQLLPGEQDSFGWLSGTIVTSKGTIVFG